MNSVDRTSRERLIAEIRQFLNGETTAFEFDDAIFDIKSDDPTVEDVVYRLWCHYDDFKDHHVALSKSEWDYFQRLLLILESDRHIEIVNVARQWRLTQLLATLTLVVFLLVVWRFGFGRHLLLFAMPFGVISMLIDYWQCSTTPIDHSGVSVMPFSSMTEMRDTYRAVQHFRKSRYPADLSDRKIRSGIMNVISMIPSDVAWLVSSPFVLLMQMLPQSQSQTRVV